MRKILLMCLTVVVMLLSGSSIYSDEKEVFKKVEEIEAKVNEKIKDLPKDLYSGARRFDPYDRFSVHDQFEAYDLFEGYKKAWRTDEERVKFYLDELLKVETDASLTPIDKIEIKEEILRRIEERILKDLSEVMKSSWVLEKIKDETLRGFCRLDLRFFKETFTSLIDSNLANQISVARSYLSMGMTDRAKEIARGIVVTYSGLMWGPYVKEAEFLLEDIRDAEAKIRNKREKTKQDRRNWFRRRRR